jgi:hypothetical protein
MVIDVAGTRLVTAYRQVLARDAAFVVVGGPPGRWLQPAGHLFASLALAPFVPQRVAWADAVGCPAKQAALTTLTELIEDGRLAPVIDRRYPFDDLQAAITYQKAGHAAWKVSSRSERCFANTALPGSLRKELPPGCEHPCGYLVDKHRPRGITAGFLWSPRKNLEMLSRKPLRGMGRRQ